MAISTVIKSIQDIMRKDTGVDGDAQRIGQLVWILFLKIYDDREQEWELLNDDYLSPIPKKLRWRNWAADPEGMTGEELKDFIDNTLFPGLQSLKARGDDQRAYVIRAVFEDAYNFMKSGQLIRQVINKIQEGINFNKSTERHELGDVYEQILRDLQNAGNAGEFYTPRAVTRFMVNRVDPKLKEIVMDPACGTGGFLTCTIDHKREHYVKTINDEKALQSTIHGVEKKPLPHLLATTNMILHGIDVPSQIRHDNTLARPLISWGPKERVHVIVANPPFGGQEEDGIKTNLLFFTKGKPTEHVWYYEHPYPPGYKSYSKTKPMRFEEFQTEIDWWGDEADGFASRKETEQAWKVSIEDIQARNYNLDIKNPHQDEQVSHDPDELLAKYEQQQADIQKIRDQLRNILAEALTRNTDGGAA